VAVRAIRGATQVDVDEREHVLAVTRDLVAEVMLGNQLEPGDVISIVFSATKDIRSVAPAVAARQLGLNDPALLCLQEMHVQGSLPRVVRLIAHVDTDLAQGELHNVYHRGTEMLRGDVPPVPTSVPVTTPPAPDEFVPCGD
jgi:chorismate mutase